MLHLASSPRYILDTSCVFCGREAHADAQRVTIPMLGGCAWCHVTPKKYRTNHHQLFGHFSLSWRPTWYRYVPHYTAYVWFQTVTCGHNDESYQLANSWGSHCFKRSVLGSYTSIKNTVECFVIRQAAVQINEMFSKLPAYTFSNISVLSVQQQV